METSRLAHAILARGAGPAHDTLAPYKRSDSPMIVELLLKRIRRGGTGNTLVVIWTQGANEWQIHVRHDIARDPVPPLVR
jgi:hypothetical protein